jgi:hypothetical protein
LLPPCLPGGCPSPSSGPPYTSGTVEYSPTGLLTAVEPATCSWVDIGTSTSAAWFYSGDYVITVTYDGVTSQPFYVPIASSAGDQDYPPNSGNENNPDGLCGPA